jgi:NADH dehydrogenase
MSQTQEQTRQQIPKVVIAGFGFAGLAAYRHLVPLARRGLIRLQIVTAEPYFVYTPLLHEYVGGIIGKESVFIPLAQLIVEKQVELHIDQIRKLDLNEKILLGEAGKYTYDYLFLGLGSEIDYHSVIGAKENSIGFKSRSNAQELKTLIYNDIERTQPRIQNIVVLGAGPDGVKISTSLRQLLDSKGRQGTEITLIDSASTPLLQYHLKIQAAAVRRLKRLGIHLLLGKKVQKVGSNYIELDDNTNLPSDLTIWTAGVKPRSLEVVGEIAYQADGRMLLGDHLELAAFPEVFVGGDLATSTAETTAGSAQIAKQKGNYLGKLLTQVLEMNASIATLPAYHYKLYGKLINFGSWSAAADFSTWVLTGPAAIVLWRFTYLINATSPQHMLVICLDWLKSIFTWSKG